ncbi:armadillo repeat-containing protein 3 [Diprion similis]|uniref:armadillo repeat-containing protein 3 n=1 Tax=Diprion similis TaxID=362088 RepID=UPI001EF955A9|nr:armadillo repeat-containing protein 3 [Diprion similis]
MVKQHPEITYSQKCKSTGKERDNRSILPKTRFDSCSIEVQDPRTAILLLKCQENSVLVNATAALSKFGSKSSDNLEILFDLDIVALVIPLSEHEDIFVRRSDIFSKDRDKFRFATKLLAEMATLPNIRNFLLSSNCYMPYFTSILQNDTDIFIHEFITLIFAELSKDMYGVAQILKQFNNFDLLFEKLRSPDPDVKKNSIEIIYNLLKDPMGAQEIIDTKDFSFPRIFELLKQPYPVIQLLALDVINLLVARNKDENIQELFRASRGPQALLEIIDNDEYDDLLEKALEILSSACDNEKSAELICSTGGIQSLLKFMESNDKKLTVCLLNLIVRLANSASSRKELYKHGIVKILLNFIHESSNPDVVGASFYGLTKMVQYGPAAEEITSSNSMHKILGFIKNESLKQHVRHAAICCLAELLACDAQNCSNLLDINGQTYLIWMIKQLIGNVPLETRLKTLRCLTSIGGYPEFREQFVDVNLIDALCTPFEFKSSFDLAELKVAHCRALSIFCIEKIARDIFLRLEGPRKLYNLLLESESVPVRNAAAQLVSQLSGDQGVAPLLILAGCLEYMIGHRSTSRIVPTWESCIKAMFNSYLPAKFAFTGRLSLHDITKDGFYVMRKNVHPFPISEQLFTFNLDLAQTIYICIPTQRRRLLDQNSEVKDYQILSNGKKNDAPRKNIYSVYSTDVTNDITGDKRGIKKTDSFLFNAVELFKCKLIAKESRNANEQEKPGLVNISFIKSRAKMLGEFVAQKMSGPDPTTNCIDHQLEIHLSEIKRDIGTNVIPLGQLQVGSYFERALLFKIIADRVCLPAALVRGDYGKAWIEIAIPEMETQSSEHISDTIDERKGGTKSRPSVGSTSHDPSFEGSAKELVSVSQHVLSIFPTKLLRPSYIVDLMRVPGDLIPLGTKQADDYCR